jgi:hypothetical protein
MPVYFRVMGNDISVSIIRVHLRGIGLVVAAWQGLKGNDWIGKESKMISILKMSIRLRL